MSTLSHIPDDVLEVMRDVWWEGFDAGSYYEEQLSREQLGAMVNTDEVPGYDSNPYDKLCKERRAERLKQLDELSQVMGEV